MREGLRTLADLVDRIEVDGVVVDDVSLARADDDGLDIELSVSLPGAGDGGIPAAGDEHTYRGAAEGTGQATPPDDPEPGGERPPSGLGVRAVEVGATLGGAHGAAARTTDGDDRTTQENAASSSSPDEPVECRVEGCDATFETDHGMKIHATKAHRADDGSGPSPHRDPERLREVYERCDTFEEMTDALEVDVTAQTVRRSMMSLDIHDPAADEATDGNPAGSGEETVDDPETAGTTDDPETAGTTDDPETAGTTDDPETAGTTDDRQPEETADDRDADDETADHAGTDAALAAEVAAVLPDEVDADVLLTAVQDASTLYQVQRALGMDREEVQHLLAELGLLDLVHGRVATEAERDIDREEIERRIVDATADVDRDDANDPDVDDGSGEVAEAD